MPRLLALACACVTLTVAPPAHAAVDPGPRAQVEQEFALAAARAKGPRAGDIFTLPQPYNYVDEHGYDVKDVSHIPGHGLLKMQGTYHSTCWHYDTRIPLVFYGQGRVARGLKLTSVATQQDLPATLAWLLNTPPPRDCAGHPLYAAFGGTRQRKPKVILTIVLDQGGRTLYAAHPGRYPEIARLMAEGSDYVNAASTNVESETGPGHVALGTGAYAGRSGVAANDFYAGGLGARNYAYTVETPHSPYFEESPSLADEWLRTTGGKAIVISQSHSDRAAIGMAGHGSAYQGNPKPIVVFYDTKSGHLMTNPAYYTLPGYVQAMDSKPYWQALTGGSGLWMGHAVGDADAVRRSPALATMEGDAFARYIEHEPVGQDDVCDLLYISFKSSDAVGHRFGYESDEAGATLAAIDHQVGRLVRATEAKAGAQNVLVVLTADHGAAPLPELSGGTRLLDEDLLALLNRRFPSRFAGRPAVLFVTTGQVYLDRPVLAASGAHVSDVAAYLRGLKINGKLFYDTVLEADKLVAP